MSRIGASFLHGMTVHGKSQGGMIEPNVMHFIKFVVKKGLFIGQIGQNRSPRAPVGLKMRVAVHGHCDISAYQTPTAALSRTRSSPLLAPGFWLAPPLQNFPSLVSKCVGFPSVSPPRFTQSAVQ
ncbi:MAG: hypothetical protein JWO87_908, partial [Phycisphaerales bacterium]|nr:hypothetical protein [Phycisphaerales bacterium]